MEKDGLKKGDVLLIMAHPDDAELGAGGTIAKWASQARIINYIICTSGNKGTKNFNLSPHQLALIREEEQLEAAKVLGVSGVTFLRYSDGELEPNLYFRSQLSLLIKNFKPQTIITHDPWLHYQIHPDHRAVGIATIDAIVSARDHLFMPEHMIARVNPHQPLELLLTRPEKADFIVDISDTMDKKLEAISKHASQLAHFPDWRSRIESWASMLGQKEGMKYGEAFKKIEF